MANGRPLDTPGAEPDGLADPEPEKDENVRPFRAFGSSDSMNDRLQGGTKPVSDGPPELAAARELASTVWDAGRTVLLSTYGLQANDPSLLIATGMGWLKVGDEGQLLRGTGQDPRPPTVAAIPNNA
jgi:hypothetical protein